MTLAKEAARYHARVKLVAKERLQVLCMLQQVHPFVPARVGTHAAQCKRLWNTAELCRQTSDPCCMMSPPCGHVDITHKRNKATQDSSGKERFLLAHDLHMLHVQVQVQRSTSTALLSCLPLPADQRQPAACLMHALHRRMLAIQPGRITCSLDISIALTCL